jgi:hypothetical protein
MGELFIVKDGKESFIGTNVSLTVINYNASCTWGLAFMLMMYQTLYAMSLILNECNIMNLDPQVLLSGQDANFRSRGTFSMLC